MILYALHYNRIDELDETIIEINKAIDEDKLNNIDDLPSVIKFEYVKSTNNKILFKGKIKPKIKENLNLVLNSFIYVIGHLILVYFLINLSARLAELLLNGLAFSILPGLFYFIKGLYLLISNEILKERTLVIENKTIYIPKFLIFSYKYIEFNNIKIIRDNNLNYLSFYNYGNLVSDGIIILVDDEDEIKTLSKFAKEISKI